MRYFIFLIFITFAIPASAGELVNKYLDKEGDVYLESVYVWCASAGASETKYRLLSFIYSDRPQNRRKQAVKNFKSWIHNARLDGNTRLVSRYKKHRPLLDNAKNCYDLAEFEEKTLRKNLNKSEALKKIVLVDKNEKPYLIGAAWSYCTDSRLNDIKARIAARWYEGQGAYYINSKSKKRSWLKDLKRQAEKGRAKSIKMADILESKKDELFSKASCKELQDFINVEIRPFAPTDKFRSTKDFSH